MYYGVVITDSLDIEYAKEIVDFETDDRVWGYANAVMLPEAVYATANDDEEIEDFFEEFFPRIFRLFTKENMEEFDGYSIGHFENDLIEF